MKPLITLAVCLSLLSACALGDSWEPANRDALTAAPAPLPPAPDARIGTRQLTCGGQSFRVAFEASRAVVVGPDGSNTELQKVDAQPGSPPNVAIYTDGMMTFTRETAAGKPDTIRFARGRMAFQDCAAAVN